MIDESSIHSLQQERLRLQQEVLRLQQEKTDLETLIEVAAEHSDYMEEELFQNVETALRENERRFRLISETVPVAILVSRRSDHHIVYANLPADSLLSVPHQELLGRNVLDIFLPEEREPLLQALALQGYLRQHEARGSTPDGSLFWVLVSAQPLEFNKESCLLSALYDVTERKQNEERIYKLNEELEKRVVERTDQLYQANQSLQDTLNNLRDVQEQLIQSEKIAALAGLTAGVAHKLNTPTGVAITAGSFLLDKTREAERLYLEGTLQRSALEKYFKLVNDSSTLILENLQKASSHIQHFKQVAVNQADAEKSFFNVKTYLSEILTFLRLKNSHHVLDFRCPDDLEIESYPGIFLQIVTHLVTNSFQHGFEEKEHGTILIEISLKDEQLFMNYQDDGKGISQKVIEKIFDPFFTTKRGVGGTGLGMYIVHTQVTQKLHGSIACESHQEGGTIVRISIPLRKTLQET